MARTHRVRYVVPAVLVSLLYANAALAQVSATSQTASFAGPGLGIDKSVDKNLQVPTCLRRDSALEPAQKVVPYTSRGFTTGLVLMTICSLGLELPSINTAPERRSASDDEIRPVHDEVGAGVATSFEQLRVLARPGDTVTLTDASFSPVSGRIDTLTSSTLSLEVNGIRRDFEQSDVTAIWAPKTDSLADGARRGFRIGAVLGVLGFLGCMGECGSTLAAAAGSFAVITAMSTGIGVGMDALDGETKNHIIYRRPAASGARVTITPQQTGMTMSVRF